MQNASTFEIKSSVDKLRLRFYDNFDIANNRLIPGPIKCYKGNFILYTTSCHASTANEHIYHIKRGAGVY